MENSNIYACTILFLLKIQKKLALFMYGVITKTCGVMKQKKLSKKLFESFLDNYQKEE